ncbi:MAG: methionyl-tRNA formyltransferase, partial [Chitinophagales bacterium]
KVLLDYLISIKRINVLVTLTPDLAVKNEVADYEDLADYARQKDIKVYHVSAYHMKTDLDLTTIKNFKIDIAFVLGWQRLVPEGILNTFSIGAFGMHGSALNLPYGRGRSPMNWSIIEGRKTFYTNLFKYDAGVDSGKVLDTFKFGIDDRDTAFTMHVKNTLAMKYLVQRNLDSLLSGEFTLQAQPDIEPTFYPKRSPADGLIDWTDDVYAIERFIRAVTKPFDGAFSFANGERVVFYSAQILDIHEFGYESKSVGKVVEVFSNGSFLIKALGGLLLVTDYLSDIEIKRDHMFNNGSSIISSYTRNRHGNFDI